ncbi:MAG: endo-1,4-beta-xylanase [Nostocaceae cyanobacterium]|nr:endo-1,4-beta-xylanase [Nostocaceae cyanobacterium]
MNRKKFITTAIGAGLASSLIYKYLNPDSAISSASSETDILKQNKNLSLKAAASNVRKLYGTAISENVVQDINYANLISRECSVAVTEGAFKWIVIEPSPGQFNFAPADQAIKFCAMNHIKLRGHTLVWHMAKPDSLSYPPPLADIQRHFNGVMGRYRQNQTLYSWDIINEVVADRPEEAEDEYGLRKGVKREYVRDIFQIATGIDSSKEFAINDYGCEDTGWKQEKFLNLIKYLKKSGVKLDTVGLQSHMWFSKSYAWNETGFKNFLAQLKSIGVKPIITELDILIDNPLPKTISELDLMVADNYKRYLDACFTGGVDTILTWGLSDKYSWLRHPDYIPKKLLASKDFIRPLPYDANLQPKLARNAILQSFVNANIHI